MPATRSPLRYPGGKTQLAKFIAHLLYINNVKDTYIEPFAGGFGVGLYLLENDNIEQAVINDLDSSVYSIWYAILNNTEKFIKKIEITPVTIEEWHKQRKIREKYRSDPFSFDNAFSSFFLNRTNISGIINGGPIGGLNQKGKYKINCRFNKVNLIKKIEMISKYKNRIKLTNLDANLLIKKEIPKFDPNSSFIFFDPPYYEQGKNLYLSFVNKSDHKELAKNILSLKNYKWITTYDVNNEILKLYKYHVQTHSYTLNYSANKKRKAREYIFSSDDTLLDSFQKLELEKV